MEILERYRKRIRLKTCPYLKAVGRKGVDRQKCLWMDVVWWTRVYVVERVVTFL